MMLAQASTGPLTFTPAVPPVLLAIITVLLAGFAAWQLLSTRGSARRDWALRLSMVLLVALIALRPVIPSEGTGPVATGGLEVYVAVDTTSSMAAEDMTGSVAADPTEDTPATRLDAAKSDIEELATALAGAQFSLTTFDGSTVQRVPLTSDASALLTATDALTQEVTYYSAGSSIDEPLVFLTDLLASAQQEHPDRRRVLFYLGDGEQTRDGAPVSFEPLAPYLSGGGVIGYGTEQGGPMRQYSGYGLAGEPTDPGEQVDPDQVEYIQDPSGSGAALSRLDRANLEAIAAQLGVPYLERATGESAAGLASGIDVGDVQVRAGSTPGPTELYWILAVPLGVLAVRELIRTTLALLAARPVSSAGRRPTAGAAR